MSLKKAIQVFLGIVCALAVSCAVSRAQDQYPFTVEVTDDGVNLRCDSTVAAEVICEVRQKQHLEVIGQAYDWYKVKLPVHAPAFVYEKYITTDDGVSGTVTRTNVNVRLRPELGAAILGQGQKGDSVVIVKKTDGWYKIEPSGSLTGWINRKFVNLISKQKAQAVSERKQGGIQEYVVVEGPLKAKFFTGIATHKLISSATKELYLLRSVTVDLNQFRNRTVRVTGVPVQTPGIHLPLLEVDKVEELSTAPFQPASGQPPVSDAGKDTLPQAQQE